MIETDGHRNHLRGCFDELGVHDRRRAHDHSIHPGVGQLSGVVDGSNSAPGLHLRVPRYRGSDRLDETTVLRRA
jgi:hypothetical protein